MTEQPDQADPLLELLADDAKSIDRNRLASFLKPYVRFDKVTKEPHFLADFASIVSNDAKVETILLASKASSLLFGEAEGMSPIELIRLEVMPEGSVKSSVKKLSDGRQIKKDGAGRYSIPNYRVGEIISRLQKEV